MMDYKYCLNRLLKSNESLSDKLVSGLMTISSEDKEYLLYSYHAIEDIRNWYNGLAMTIDTPEERADLYRTFSLIKSVYPPDNYPDLLYRLVMVTVDESKTPGQRRKMYLNAKTLQVTEHPITSFTTNEPFTVEFYDAFYKRLKVVGGAKKVTKDAVTVTAHISPVNILTTTQTLVNLATELANQRLADRNIDYGWVELAQDLPDFLFAQEVICYLPEFTIPVERVEVVALHA